MDTKIKALILLLFSAFTTFAQTPGINFAAKFNITSATGGDPYNITGIVLDDLSRFTGSDVQVNDSIYVIDGDQLYVLAVTSITSVVGPTVTLVANDPNNAGVSIPTGQAAICRPTDNYKLPLYISGLRDDLRSMVMNRQAQLIDDINGSAVSAITDFTSAGVNVPPSPAASLNGGETWRNMTTGELWGSDGNVWYPFSRGPKECQDTVLVSAITVQSGGSVTTGSPLVKSSGGVWQHMYNHPSGLNLIPDGVVTDIIVGGKAIIQYCGVRKGSGATPNTSYYVDQSISTGFTTTKPATNIRPLGKVASNGDFIINAGLLFSRDNIPYDYLDSLDYEIQTLRQSLGTSYNNTNMGVFTGTILTDNIAVKPLLQELGDAIQSVADAPKPYWNLNGNTSATGKFIGTTDTTPVEIKVNNVSFFKKKYTSTSDDGLAFGPGSGLNFRSRISGISRSTAFGINVLPLEDGNNRSNTGFGFEVLNSCTTCASNVGVGFQALKNLTTGTGNMAVGTTALQSLITGSYNLGIGVTSLNSTTTGNFNIGLGFQALQLNQTGGLNVGIGYNALNQGVFASSVVGIGGGAGFANTSSNCIFVGTGAGTNHNSGSNCIEICNNPLIASSPTYNYGDVILIGTNISNTSSLSNIIGIGSLPTAANRIKIGRSTDTRIDLNVVPIKIDVAPTEGQTLKTVAGVLTATTDTVRISLEVANTVTTIESASYPYNIGTSFWRVPSKLNGWKIVGADYAFFSAATGGNTVIGLRLNNTSDIANTTISAGSVTAASSSITQSVVTGDLIQATMPNTQTFTVPAKGLYITIYLTR